MRVRRFETSVGTPPDDTLLRALDSLNAHYRIIVRAVPSRTASTQNIFDQINARRLYLQKDGRPVFPD